MADSKERQIFGSASPNQKVDASPSNVTSLAELYESLNKAQAQMEQLSQSAKAYFTQMAEQTERDMKNVQVLGNGLTQTEMQSAMEKAAKRTSQPLSPIQKAAMLQEEVDKMVAAKERRKRK